MHTPLNSLRILLLAGLCLLPLAAGAQTPPSAEEIAAYEGLHAAVASGRASEIEELARAGGDIEARDGTGRTPLIVAAFRSDTAAARALLAAGANSNVLDNQSYDALTVAAVQGDMAMLKLLLESGANPRAITSPYGGTALIAAAHRGHVAIVEALLAAKAPVNHVNNLGWTALMEAIVLGDGSERYQQIVDALIRAEADLNLADRNNTKPLALAKQKGLTAIAALLEKAGAQP
jgi:ankyrin repeat protein